MPRATKSNDDYILTLELDRREAEVLFYLLGRCHAQGLQQPIYSALHKAGVTMNKDAYKDRLSGSLESAPIGVFSRASFPA